MLRPQRLALVLLAMTAFTLIGWRSAQTQSGGLRRITNTSEEGNNLNPSVSGDGRIIAFESTEDIAGAGGSDQFRAIRSNVAVDPPAFFQIGGTRAAAPAISQDGSRITFASKDDPVGMNPDGNSEIFLFDGATLRQVTNTSPGDISNRIVNGNFQPSLSDDGRFIAFSSNRDLTNQNADGNLEIFIYDSIAATLTQLTNSSAIVGFSDAKISGNGTKVAYIRDAGATPSVNRDLMIQDRTSEAATVVASQVPSLALTYGRAISDDGARVVYSELTAPNVTQVFLFDGRGGNSNRQITSLGSRVAEVPLHATISGDGLRIAFAARRSVIGGNSDGSVELYLYDIPSGTFSKITNAPSSATADVVSSLNDDGSTVVFNFPRVLSGAVSDPSLANDSEIYVTTTPARPSSGTLTVLNGASFGAEPSSTKAVAPDSIAVARGGSLANTTQQSQRQADGTFPTNVAGTTVTVNGRSAEIFFVSPAQVNFLVPAATEIATATVVVTNADGFPSQGSVPALRAASGIFTFNGDGTGEGVILNSDTLQRGPFDPTNGNLRLSIFATGARNAAQTQVIFGGRVVNAEMVAASPDMTGLDEVHVLVPSDLRGAGTVSVFLLCDGRASNSASITFTGDPARDIVINEVLADPPDGITGDANHDGVRDSSQDEFVELVNSTTHDIDISGYQFLVRNSNTTADGTPRHVFAGCTILPAGTAIVVFGGGNPDPNNSIFAGAQIVKASSGGLSLINGGAVITLKDSANSVINFFEYGGSTGLDGDANQSLTRSPDLNGVFTLHQSAIGSGAAGFSPGTHIDSTPFVPWPPVARLDVSPSSATIIQGQQQTFTARAFDSNNQQMNGVLFTWKSGNTSLATIDCAGTATGVAAGISQITATVRGVQSAPATLTVASPSPTPTPQVVISQVYGGGGNSGAPFRNDFIEIFNRGSSTVNVAGWSVQQASATGTSWSVTPLCPSGSCIIAPGTYFLVQEASSGAIGAALPAPDAVGTSNLAAASGKIALVSTTNALSGSGCPPASSFVDFVGYGTSADCFEGSNHAVTPANTTADFRRSGGCIDTNDNAADFLASTPFPRNSSAPANNCSGGTPPSLTIDDVMVTEGNSGTVTATFTVSLSSPASGSDVTFDIATQDNTATVSNNDYVAKSLTNQTILAGQQTYTFTVTVNGDTAVEPDETFLVNVTNVSGTTVTDPQGAGAIKNDDLPSLSINDVAHNEGNGGPTTFSFTVNLSAPAPATVIFDIATQNGTATVADNDYVARSLTGQTIPAGQQTYTFDVMVNGDLNVEPNETFSVDVTNASGASVLDAQGTGTIQNDDSPVLSINDVIQAEGNNATSIFTFTVSLSLPAPLGGVTFDLATQDNTATVANSDYVARSLASQTIPAGQQTYSFDVTINGDIVAEPNESFFVNVTNVSGASLLDGQGAGTIQNDDTPNLVISQAYGGGGNTGAAYQNDFVELFNRGATTVDFSITPYSVQYASAAANFNSANKVDLTAGVLAPGQYFLIKLGTGGAVGQTFTADITKTGINMSATDGKVALVLGTTVATTTSGCPTGVTVADLLSYGSANCAEGTATAALSATKVDLRNNHGCADMNSNSVDFTVTIVNTSTALPRNSSSAAAPCP